jgi:hypothetical protein
VPIVNSANSPVDFGRQLNFIVGGNILGRGLTIDNLLVTYYLRRAKVSQMDTVLQHARMFGYRQPLMPYTRSSCRTVSVRGFISFMLRSRASGDSWSRMAVWQRYCGDHVLASRDASERP